MNITIHRGTHEIGGTCVELCAHDTRIILDVGMPLVERDATQFNVRKYKGLSAQQRLDAGVLPPVEGLYTCQTPSVDALLVSHAHQDHHGFLNHVHPEVPVYLGEGTQRLLEISSVFTQHKTTAKNPKRFAWPGEFRVGAFRIVPHLVDHSAFGAFAFEIEAEGKRLFYSGDFRKHGHIGKTLNIIKDRVRPGVDVLMMEGTMLGREDEPVLTEEELAERATEICRECPKAVLVYQSGQNVSRAVSFYKAARRSGREFVTDFYTAHVLTELGHCVGGENLPYPGKPGFETVRVWYPNYLTDRIVKGAHGDIPYRYSPYKMTKEEMAEKLDRIILFVRPGVEKDLERIAGLKGSVLIYSLWKGYLERGKTKRFVEKLKAAGITVEFLHSSGHADIATLKGLVNTLKPKTLIPVHTFHPDQYADEFGTIVQTLEDGEGHSI